ncbi:hypothetical protein [Sphingomonas bacterium]|uniref:hypothetical protein n=1 Tax=Sphingomonas bacterium TaxID=1895847 RepID=UPI00261A14FE|nr:hypothetical protein [Sphingomonas bacterium]
MAAEYNQTGRSVSIGRILSRTFSAIGSNPGVMLTIAFVFGALPSTAISYYQQTLAEPLRTGALRPRDYFIILALSALANMVLNLIVQGGLVRATMTAAEGDRATLGECLGTGLRRALPLLGVAILGGLGISLGFLLLIVPGVILYLMWSVVGPVVVVERHGVIGSLSRSSELTSGAKGSIFALMLIVWVVLIGATMVSGAAMVAIYGVQGLARAVQDGLPIAFLIVQGLIATVTTVFASAIPTALYVELREWKEGAIGESLSDIFA